MSDGGSFRGQRTPMSDEQDPARPGLRLRRVALDTGRENLAVISRRSRALRPEVFHGFSRVELRSASRVLLATLVITDDDIIGSAYSIRIWRCCCHSS